MGANPERYWAAMDVVRRRVVVRGLVQGVWFRESARRRADELGVSGWVRNNADGTVEAEVEGAADDVAVLVSWLGLGPPQARVDVVDVEEQAPRGERGFCVR
jgi:acylphosphatase